MKKQISISSAGQKTSVGGRPIERMIPNRYVQAVGPIVFLDHIVPAVSSGSSEEKLSTGGHPHRGIITLTYLIHGEGEHRDSRGHHARISSGGMQWMKAGNGIVHDETMNPDKNSVKGLTHGFQFWINLPSKQKTEQPEYINMPAEKIPFMNLDEQGSFIKILVGEYQGHASAIPQYSKHFIYHLHLAAERSFSIDSEPVLEYAALISGGEAIINDASFNTGELVVFGNKEGAIVINNTGTSSADIMLFGGEPYSEPIIAQGPFVMNSHDEIELAYQDYHLGKYGKIDYSNNL
jgi:hypothetical protein